MKKTILLLLLLLRSNLAFAIDPDAVRAAYKKLNLAITDDQTLIDKQYRKLIAADGVAFSQEGKKIRQARDFIMTFIKEYDVEILIKSNKSAIFKKENFDNSRSLQENFMRLVEDNENRLKFAFMAPYSGGHSVGFDDGPRRAARFRETIYPAYYEIKAFYRSYYEKDLTSVDYNTLSAALDFQINSKISVVHEIENVYDNLPDDGKEIYSILMTILADEGTRLDIEVSKRTEYFLNRMKTIKKASQTITEPNLIKFKKLFQKMNLEGGITGGVFAPYYFDTIILLNKDSSSSLLALAPKEVNEKFFLFHGTLAPFIGANLNPHQKSALKKLTFQLASLLKKNLGDNKLMTVDTFNMQQKRIALILEITGMNDKAIDPEVLNMTVKELEKVKAKYIHSGRASCLDLMNAFFNI